jgi:hypothetical protein
MALTEAQLAARRKGGQALVARYGRAYMRELGRRGYRAAEARCEELGWYALAWLHRRVRQLGRAYR